LSVATEETIELFTLFDPRTKVEAPGVTAAIGQRVVAFGSPDAFEGAGSVAVYTYVEARNAWGYVGVLMGSPTAGATSVRRLGASIAVIDDTLVIGAPGDEMSPGRVVVAEPPYGLWTYGCVPAQAILTSPKSARGDGFGTAVACCYDGTDHYVAVSAPNAEPPRGPYGIGQVYVFKGLATSDQPWSANAAANPQEEAPATEGYGTSVAITHGVDASGAPDGTIVLAVGAPGAKEGQGAVYVGATTEPGVWPSRWSFDQTIEPKFPDYIDEEFRTAEFGTSVAMAGGTTLAVGSPADPNFELEIEGTGAVWIYHRTDGQFALEQEGGSMYGKGEEARFGTTIAFPSIHTAAEPGAAASHLVVGAPGARSALLYVSGGPGQPFSESADFTAFGGKKGDKFATAVATSSNNGAPWSVVAAPGDKAENIEGGGYLYAQGSSGMTWLEPPVMVEEPAIRWCGSDTYTFIRFTPTVEKYLD
jgi:hypothetical protein